MLASFVWLDHVSDKRLPGPSEGSPGNNFSWLNATLPTVLLDHRLKLRSFGLLPCFMVPPCHLPRASAAEAEASQREEHPTPQPFILLLNFPGSVLGGQLFLSPPLGFRVFFFKLQEWLGELGL